MKIALFALTLGLLTIAGCTRESRSPDSIREHAANATAATKRDAKAIAQGVFEGLARKGPVNINKATKEQLLELPGLTARSADAIIAGRPYANAAELRRRHILSKAEYDKVAGHVVAK